MTKKEIIEIIIPIEIEYETEESKKSLYNALKEILIGDMKGYSIKNGCYSYKKIGDIKLNRSA
ncbi:MAG: hypothetical protein PHQ91_15910 [Thermoanaerobaculaceae bacterium]|nr:hypothetical protein [Thermoanaerobaculaceae bacterium]